MRIGITGNLLRPDIDRKTLLEIITNHTDCSFEFYGPTSIHESNIGGSGDDATSSFLQELRQLQNTQLHGVLSPQQLALEYRNIDAFLICYDPKLDQSKATNYHKIAEFLTYGSPVISNYVSAYDFEDSGVFMVGKNENQSCLRCLNALLKGRINDFTLIPPLTLRIREKFCRLFNSSQIVRPGRPNRPWQSESFDLHHSKHTSGFSLVCIACCTFPQTRAIPLSLSFPPKLNGAVSQESS